MSSAAGGNLPLPNNPGYSRNSKMRGTLHRSRISWAGLLGAVCIALVLLAGTIQAAHFHTSAQADHDCALCVVAHHAPAVASPIALEFSSRTVARLVAPKNIDHPRRAVYIRLAIRPPPASSASFAHV